MEERDGSLRAGKHAGNKLRMQKQQVQLAGKRCREPGQRLETSTAQRDPGGAAQQGVGSPLQWLSLVAGSAHCVYPSRIKPRTACDD